MSQAVISIPVKKIEEKLPNNLKDPKVLNDTEKLSSAISKLNEQTIAYLMEARQHYSESGKKSRIQKIDKITKNVFEDSRIKIVGFETRNADAEEEYQSHQISIKLRKMAGLPPLKNKARKHAIRDLQGILQDYVDKDEDPVDAIKNSREY